MNATYKRWLLVSLSLISTQRAYAAFDDDLANATSQSVYNIKSTCNSSGQFTAKALEHTRNLRTIITSLKDDKACAGLKESMNEALKGLGENLSKLQGTSSELQTASSEGSLQSVPQEMAALRTFAYNFPMANGQSQVPNFLSPTISAALSRAAMKQQRVDMVARGTPDVVSNPRKMLSPAQALKILNSKNDMRAATATGLSLLNTTLDNLINSKANCLDSSGAAQFGTGLTQVLASFIAGGEGSAMSSSASMALDKIVTYMTRDKKYVDSIRELNKVEFYSTLSCLVEMTSEGYCEVQDAKMLLKEVKKDFDFVETKVPRTEAEIAANTPERTIIEPKPKNFTSLLEKGPMAGHFLLANQIPIVTEWINKIQFGVEPQLPTEAQMQVDVFKTGLQPFITMKELMGTFNLKFAQLKKSESLAAKQNLALDMLFLVSDGFTRGGGGGLGQNNVENFFIRVHPDNRMAFSLLGIPYESMPDEVFKPKNNIVMQPEQYIRINFQTSLPQFKDPEALAILIKKNAEEIFTKANYLAEQYFLQFFIPDETAVVTESMVGMNKGDVRSALQQIDLYVKDFIERVGTKDPAVTHVAEDLRMRLGKVLARYKQLHEFGLQKIELKKQGKLVEKDFRDSLETMSRDFIQDVYDLFNIKRMRAAWLQNRMMILIKKDYSLAMQKRDFSNKYIHDLMMATGLEALNQLFGMSGVNFNSAANDMARAQDIYWKNLQALERIAQAPMQNYINDFRLRSDPDIIDHRDLAKEANRYTYNRYAEQTPTNLNKPRWFRMLHGAVNNLSEGLFGGFGIFGKNVEYGWTQDKFQEAFNTQRPDLTDTSDGGAGKLWAQNCTVILGFYNLEPYWYLCKKATLFSEFYDAEKYKNQPAVLNFLKDNLSTNFVKAAYSLLDPKDRRPPKEAINRNREIRICALRDHYRKNYVMQIAATLQQTNEVYENEYTALLERPKIEEVLPTATGATGADGGFGNEIEFETPSSADLPQMPKAPKK